MPSLTTSVYGGGGGQCEAKGFWAQVAGRGWVLLHLMTAASFPTIWVAGRSVGPKPEATWEEWAVRKMIQGPPWLRIPPPPQL